MSRAHRLIDVREVLAHHACCELVMYSTISKHGSCDLYRNVLTRLEQRAAEEIERIYSEFIRRESHPEAIQCEDCGGWLLDEFCQCEQEKRVVIEQFEASIALRQCEAVGQI